MTSKKMVEALNKQVQAELYSSYLYLSMAAYSDRKNWKGFANWMRVQAAEENEHAMKIFDYLLEIGEKVTLLAIEKPPTDFGTPKEMMSAVLEHEQKVTAMIHKLYELAIAEKDYRSQIMLQWFVTEQIEEEAQVQEILDKIEQVGEKSTAVWWIDKELKKRGKD
ncbi:MAG: ferritin [bacterium]|nr:ferritin [bacterium]